MKKNCFEFFPLHAVYKNAYKPRDLNSQKEKKKV